MPAPRFPSMPNLMEDPTPAVSPDFHSEAQRTADAARRAADYADAVAWAASLTGEAMLLANAGRAHEALQKLREAQAIEMALARGEVRQAWSREGATVAVIVTMALLIVVLAVSLAVGS
jgi:hypothetical protein